ncbi:MAG: nicotinate (nicotinamide) nucleotide adenylyltransferase [Elusimicrobia bacterium]|nr:nicotinate (nicotinamide) nucleotide adenylyltransferase [Elusimicrobiota bacterium]
MKKERIIIYGGSFDPPHKAHFKLLKSAIKEIRPDKVYVVVGWQSPFKSFSSVSYHDRERMFKIGAREFNLGGISRLIFHPFEYDRKKITYTYQTINYFSLKHPRSQLFFLMGSDCFNSFNRWKNYKLIMKKAVLLVGKRKGFLPVSLPKKAIVFLKDVFPEISSSEVKKTLFIKGFSKNILVSVSAYMEQKKLYLIHIHKWLKLNLNRKRFRHCKEMTKLALELADKYGVDLEKTAIATLLHDAARDLRENKLKLWANKNRKKIPFFRFIMDNAPLIFHSYMSADIARSKFFIKDRDILNAIKLHAIGALRMSILGKIVYVSDIAGKDRDAAFAATIRKEAFFNIDAAFFSALKCKLEYIIKEKKRMHPRSRIVYQALSKKIYPNLASAKQSGKSSFGPPLAGGKTDSRIRRLVFNEARREIHKRRRRRI